MVQKIAGNETNVEDKTVLKRFKTFLSVKFFFFDYFFSVRELNSHLIMVLQFVVSVATAFVFGYLAPYLFYGTEAVGPR